MKKTPILILVAVILMLSACIVVLLSERSKLNDRLDYQIALQEKQSEQILASADDQASLTGQNEALTQQLQETRDAFDALNTEAASFREQAAAMEADYQQKLEAAQMENTILSNIQQGLNNQLANQKDADKQVLDETLGRLQQIEQANAELTEKLNAEKEEIARLNAELASASAADTASETSAEIEALKDQINGLSAALTAAEQQTRQAEDDYALCQGTIAMLNERYEEQERTIAALRASTDGQTADKAEVSQELNALRGENERLTQQYDALCLELQPIQRESETLRAENLQLKEQLQALTEQSQELAVLHSENERLTQQYDALCLELQPIQRESETLRAENLQLKEQLQTLAEQGEANAAEFLRLMNEAQKVQRAQAIPKVEKLFITCENRYHKKTYFNVTPEEALQMEITPGTITLHVQLMDAEGNVISY